MDKIIAYKCSNCGKLWEDDVICGCIVNNLCTHKNIRDINFYEDRYMCMGCHLKTPILSTIKKERKNALRKNGGMEISFEKVDNYDRYVSKDTGWKSKKVEPMKSEDFNIIPYSIHGM